jgi:D-alanyl-D-alanine carboxypeptidase
MFFIHTRFSLIHSVFLFFMLSLISFFNSSVLYCQDYEPVECDSALPYKGPPLHDELGEEVWRKLLPELSGKLESGLCKKLDVITDDLLELTKSPAISAAVGIPGRGIWSLSTGIVLTGSEIRVDSSSYFHWASIGKTFTATAVMQLIEEKKLDYHDPLADWFPEFPNAKAITIDHLLTHTSGIFSFNSDIPFREERGYRPPADLLEIAKNHGNAFCPGEYWSYSNTNYILLALIMEKIEKIPLHVILTERIIKPLSLSNTIALTPQQELPGLVKGHTEDGPDEMFDETTPFGAGIIVASAEDMIRFWHGLLSGRLISPTSVRAAFQTLYQMFQPGIFYGRGVMLYDVKNDAGERVVWWLGHSGGTPGLKAVIGCDVESGIYVAVALNNASSAEALANRLLTEIKTLLE